MNCDRDTVAACVFHGHDAATDDRHECPLAQVLMRRVRNLGIEDEPAQVDRELDKYRDIARVLNCPMLAKVRLRDLSPRPASPLVLPLDRGARGILLGA